MARKLRFQECDKCGNEFLENETVWCNTCGLTYCKECSVVGLPTNYPLPKNILDDVFDEDEWKGDLGFVMDECVNCYLDWLDEDVPVSNAKYTKEDLDGIE